MSSAQFLQSLFGALPEFFKEEDSLREIWSNPITRKKLLEGLSEKGFNKEVLVEMQRIVNAENSDLFDLLAHVAFALQPVTSSNRATNAKNEIENHFADKQTAFIDFVLGIYIKQGADEFRQEKLKDLIGLKYQSIYDATLELGDTSEIRQLLLNFNNIYTNQACAH